MPPTPAAAMPGGQQMQMDPAMMEQMMKAQNPQAAEAVEEAKPDKKVYTGKSFLKDVAIGAGTGMLLEGIVNTFAPGAGTLTRLALPVVYGLAKTATRKGYGASPSETYAPTLLETGGYAAGALAGSQATYASNTLSNFLRPFQDTVVDMMRYYL
ncbi:MAG: hypothetical protein ABIC95_05710 [archaeon]